MPASTFHAPASHRWSWARTTDILCWLAIGYLGWFALHFYAERIHGDASYFLLKIVDEGTFFVSHGRWIMPLSQWMAVLGVKAGVPMTTLITLYSLGNVAIVIFAFSFVRYGLHDRSAGIAVIATQMLGLADALFCPVFEFYYGSMLLVVCLALIRNGTMNTKIRLSLFAVLLFLTLSSHFMAMLVAVMTLFTIRVWQDRAFGITTAAVFLAHLAVRLTFLSDYEERAIDSLWIRFDVLGMCWAFHPGRLFAHGVHALVSYPDVILLSLLATFTFIRQRAWRTAFLFCGGILVIYVLQSLYFPDGTHSIYREIVDYPFAVWVIVVVFAMRPVTARVNNAWRWAIMGCLVYRCVAPLQIADTYTARVAWMRDRIREAHEQGIQRGFVLEPLTHVPPSNGAGPFTAVNPTEVILLSAEAGPDATVVLFPTRTAVVNDSIEDLLERKLIDSGIPLIWHSRSPYFNMAEEPFRILR